MQNSFPVTIRRFSLFFSDSVLLCSCFLGLLVILLSFLLLLAICFALLSMRCLFPFWELLLLVVFCICFMVVFLSSLDLFCLLVLSFWKLLVLWLFLFSMSLFLRLSAFLFPSCCCFLFGYVFLSLRVSPFLFSVHLFLVPPFLSSRSEVGIIFGLVPLLPSICSGPLLCFPI